MSPNNLPHVGPGCPDQGTLFAFVAGKLPEAEREMVAQHLSYCALCRSGLDAVERAAPQPADTPDSPPTIPGKAGSTLPPHEDPLAGGTRFQPLHFHAKGGLGEVHVALDTELNRTVALKRIRDERADDADSRRRFRLEAEITSQLEHPGVVPVYGLVQGADGQPTYAMRFIQGESLQDALQRFHQAEQSGRDPSKRRLEFRALLNRLVAACNTIAFAHSRGIIHRDVKPANIMLGKYGETLVVDWGLARPVGAGAAPAVAGTRPPSAETPPAAPTQTVDFVPGKADGASGQFTSAGQVLGTPAYMAPEQARGEVEVLGPAADIYALGAVLHEILTGQPPYQGATGQAVLQQVVAGPPPSPVGLAVSVPRALNAICRQAMARKPRDRYATALALAADVEHWLADEPVTAYREPWRVRAGRWVRRHRTAVTAVSAVLLAAVFMGGVAWLLVTAERTERLEQEARLARAEQKQAEQRAERTRQVEAELRRAQARRAEARRAPLEDVAKWHEAFAAVKRAEGILSGGAADAKVRTRLQKMLRALQAEARDRRLLAKLEKARLHTALAGKEGSFDLAGASAQYALVFREEGLDLLRINPREAARRIKQRAIQVQIVAALDDWAELAIVAALDDWAEIGPDAKLKKRLLAIITVVDPDPASFRSRWRKARSNRKKLVLLATAPEVWQLSAGDLARLGRSLFQAGALPQAVELLRKGWDKYPGDFWINFELAYALSNMKPPPLSEVIRFYSAALAVRPRSSVVYYNLGLALKEQKDLLGAIAAFKKAVEINPRFAVGHNNLGVALYAQKNLAGAIAAFRQAIEFNPKDARAYNNLGSALKAQKNLPGAIGAYRQAIELNPRFAEAYSNLGLTLYAQKDLPGASAAFRQAIELNAKDAGAYYNLGITLKDQKDLAGAIAAFRQALDINPRFRRAYSNLGVALVAQKDLPGAIAAFRQALELNPKDALAYNNLGIALKSQKELPRAIAAFRQALDINPRFAEAYSNLGVALAAQKDLPGAIAAYRKAIEFNSRYARAYYNLGLALKAHKDLPGASTAFRQAIDINPRNAGAHINLGVVFFQQAEFAQALAAFKQGAQWLPSADPRRPALLQLIRSCQHLADLESKLPARLSGKEQLASAAQRLEYAQLCYRKQLYAATARFYKQAFTADPKLADDLKSSNRYHAACCAALASAGQGKDSPRLDDKQRSRWRQQALAWVRADLTQWDKQLAANTAQARVLVRKQLAEWQHNSELAGIRAAAALAKMPPEEQAACKKLWADVAALLNKASE